jgi:uncharacterized Zn finger protein
MRLFPTYATCDFCHHADLELISNDDMGLMLLCMECGFVRVAKAQEMFQGFTICA